MLPGDLISYVKKVGAGQRKYIWGKCEAGCSGSSTRAEFPRGQISEGSATNKAEKHNQLYCL